MGCLGGAPETVRASRRNISPPVADNTPDMCAGSGPIQLEYANPRIDLPPRRRAAPWLVVAATVALGFFLFDRMSSAHRGRRGLTHAITSARAETAILGGAVDRFEIDTGRLPTAAEGLGALRDRPPRLVRWRGPYIKRYPVLDPWGRPYVYRVGVPGGGRQEFQVFSLGPDGKQGTADDIIERSSVQIMTPNVEVWGN